MLFNFANVLVFLAFGAIFVGISLTLSKLLAPIAPNNQKAIPYECGELPVGTPWIRFNPRYYKIALVFLIFDVEIAFMFPCVVIYKSWIASGLGKVAFMEIAAFAFILMAGLVYIWKKGDLTWVRSVTHHELDQEGKLPMANMNSMTGRKVA